MKIENKRPDHTCDLSLTAIDCGFDPRAHHMLCTVPASARRVGYERDGEARIVEGTLNEIVAELRDAGYSIHVDVEGEGGTTT